VFRLAACTIYLQLFSKASNKNVCGTYSASYSMSNGTISLMYSGQGMKRATQAEVKNKWSYATISSYIYMPCVETNFTSIFL